MRKETETLGETNQMLFKSELKKKTQRQKEKRQRAGISERQVFVPRTETQVRPQNDFI